MLMFFFDEVSRTDTLVLAIGRPFHTLKGFSQSEATTLPIAVLFSAKRLTLFCCIRQSGY